MAWNSLAVAGLVTLALSPGEVFDIGTQLSFLAVAVLFSRWPALGRSREPDPLRQLIEQSRPGWLRAIRTASDGVGQLTVTSLVVWLVTLPLVANRFHLVPLFGAVLTLLLWLPVAAALFSGLAVLVAEPVPLVADGLGWMCGRALVADARSDRTIRSAVLGTRVGGRAVRTDWCWRSMSRWRFRSFRRSAFPDAGGWRCWPPG